MKKQYITDTIKEEYKEWEVGQTILINAGTGAGKSYFVQHKLLDYANSKNKKVLYLTNRTLLKEQVKKDISKLKVKKIGLYNLNLKVMNYQSAEKTLINNFGEDVLYQFDYIVCDEAHYFFTDANFNSRTDILLKKLLANSKSIKILLTATSNLLEYYLEKKEYKIDYKYTCKKDYTYINNIEVYNNYKTIENIIEEIPKNEKTIFFSSSKKRALEISKKFKGSFICSLSDENYYNDIDMEERNNIRNNCKFNKRLLCTTTTLDNGINIKDKEVRHIIIDILDIDTFIQCLGRVREQEGQIIHLYFYNWDKAGRRINGFKKKINNTLERADYLLENGQDQYILKKFKNDNFIDGRIIDDVPMKKGGYIKKVNQCIYYKYVSDMLLFSGLLNNELQYKDIIVNKLHKDKYKIIEREVKEIEQSLDEFLNSIVGVKMFKEEQKVLKSRMEEYGLKARTLGINTLNGYITDKNLPYIILKKMTSKIVYGKKKNIRYWELNKIAECK